MTPEDFKPLRNFSYDEVIKHYKSKGYSNDDAEKEIEKIEYRLFLKLQDVRTAINSVIRINCITDGKHTAGSFHYKAQAIDWHSREGTIDAP